VALNCADSDSTDSSGSMAANLKFPVVYMAADLYFQVCMTADLYVPALCGCGSGVSRYK